MPLYPQFAQPRPEYSANLTAFFARADIAAAWRGVTADLAEIAAATELPAQDKWTPKKIAPYFAHKCQLMTAYTMLGYADNSISNIAGQKSMMTGRVLHPAIENALADAGLLEALPDGQAAMEVPMLPPNIPAEGVADLVAADLSRSMSADAILKTQQGKVICDIKTVPASKFALVNGAHSAALSTALLAAAAQIRLYMRLTRIPMGAVLLVNYDTGEQRGYMLRDWLSDTAFARLVEMNKTIAAAKEMLAAGKAPSYADLPTPEPGDDCAFCYANERAQMPIPALDKPQCTAPMLARGDRKVKMSRPMRYVTPPAAQEATA